MEMSKENKNTCLVCKDFKKGLCFGRVSICNDFEKAYEVPKNEQKFWPEYGDATSIRLSKTNGRP